MQPEAEIDCNEAVVVALGSNLGLEGRSSINILQEALAQFGPAGLRVQCRSSWWRSAAWPDPTEPPYINGVALVETDLRPQHVLDALHGIEASFGRVRERANASRVLDLDLIAYGRAVLSAPGLTLPHPRAAERRFVMGPLAQIAPAWRHPVLSASAETLARRATVGRDAAPMAG
jgi:2-amino-4-hydroxy-6-hydroxymethyldihydropteridine diphosphokinase